MLLFSNNATTTLAAALTADSGDTEMVVVSAALFRVVGAGDGDAQLVTLTHPDLPNLHEIVSIVETDGTTFTVVREVEGTEVQEWPIGTKVSARITAGTLEEFVQQSSIGNFVERGRSRRSQTLIPGKVYLERTRSDGGHMPDNNFAHEQIGGSNPVDLGSAITWSTGTHYLGSVVVPTTPDGYQYWLDIPEMDVNSSTDATEPDFNGPGGGAAADNGWWFPTELPPDITTQNFSGLMVTEVGFIAHKYTASSPAVVSIGTASDPTRYANGVTLSQISADTSVHRIAISAGGALVNFEGLRFRVDAAASGGRCLGRFYWRGFFVDSSSTL